MNKEQKLQTGFIQKSIDYNGRPTKYVVYVPASYDPDRAAPTILFLHGLGETGTDGWKQVSIGLGPAIMCDSLHWDFLLIFPQRAPSEDPVPRAWIALEPLILNILEKTKQEYHVADSRLYCTGLSMGGYGTWAIAAKHPDLFAAIAPICGGGDPSTAPNLKDIPIWCFHGDQDIPVPLRRSFEMIDAIKAAGGHPKLTIYPGVGHNSWDKAYREEKLYDWFDQHVRK